MFTFLSGLLRPSREGALHLHPIERALREQSKPGEGALLAFCVNQGISASFSLLYFLIGRLRTTRFQSIKGPQQWDIKKMWNLKSLVFPLLTHWDHLAYSRGVLIILEPSEKQCGQIVLRSSIRRVVKNVDAGTPLVVQWLRLCTPNAGGSGLIPGQGTRSYSLLAATKGTHVPQLRPGTSENADSGASWPSCKSWLHHFLPVW